MSQVFSNMFLLILGGSLGTVSRYYLAEWGQARFGTWLPYGTLLVNLGGCLIVGLLLGVLESRFHALAEAPVQLRLLLFSGFLGAFTTFSSYELEALLYFRQGLWERALLYLAGSIVLGLLLMAGGWHLARMLLRP